MTILFKAVTGIDNVFFVRIKAKNENNNKKVVLLNVRIIGGILLIFFLITTALNAPNKLEINTYCAPSINMSPISEFPL